MDHSASTIPMAGIESSVDDKSAHAATGQGGVLRRRRDTGKATKSNSQVATSIIKSEPIDLAESVVPGSSCSTSESLSRSWEVFSILPAFYILLIVPSYWISASVITCRSVTLWLQTVYCHMDTWLNYQVGTNRPTFIGQESAYCGIHF